MPFGIYFSFLGRCTLKSREYALLRNGLIEHVPDEHVDLLLSEQDADLILEHAKKVFPQAARFIQACELSNGSPGKQAGEFRRTRRGTTWHFCTKCSQWPTGPRSVVSQGVPFDLELCNECVAKNRLGDCC